MVLTTLASVGCVGTDVVRDKKDADMVILDKNPLQVEPLAIKDIKIVESIKEGRTIFRQQ